MMNWLMKKLAPVAEPGRPAGSFGLSEKHKEVYSLLLDYGSIKQHLLNNSIANNRKILESFGINFSEDDLIIAAILTVSSLFEAFRYMVNNDRAYDMDKILEYMIAISNQRYKELTD